MEGITGIIGNIEFSFISLRTQGKGVTLKSVFKNPSRKPLAFPLFIAFKESLISPSKTVTLKIVSDASPVLLLIELLRRAMDISKTPIDLGNDLSELVRVETDHGSARAGELHVTLYPSDRFLRHAATFLAGKLDLGIIEGIQHEQPPSKYNASRPQTWRIIPSTR